MSGVIPEGFQRSLMEQWLFSYIRGEANTPAEWLKVVTVDCPHENKNSCVHEDAVQAFIDLRGEEKMIKIAEQTKSIIMTVAETVVREN